MLVEQQLELSSCDERNSVAECDERNSVAFLEDNPMIVLTIFDTLFT